MKIKISIYLLLNVFNSCSEWDFGFSQFIFNSSNKGFFYHKINRVSNAYWACPEIQLYDLDKKKHSLSK